MRAHNKYFNALNLSLGLSNEKMEDAMCHPITDHHTDDGDPLDGGDGGSEEKDHK